MAHIFAGVQILTPALFDAMPDGAFSLNDIYDKAQAQNRLFGHLLDGFWMHVGTPQVRMAAEDYLARQ
jgi:MurNAc alpha-1-phosphate uridylyltransferase